MKPFSGIRDRFVVALANIILSFGSAELQYTIAGLMDTGMTTLKDDQ